MPGTWRHLAARFFSVLSARSLDAGELERVASLLRPAEQALFLAQPAIDQRHALDAATSIGGDLPDRVDLQRAALLHDVGKRHARLGVVGRVLATLAAKLRLAVRGRFRAYLDHGPMAARELADLGAEPVVVAYARYHHGPRPPGFSPGEWELLQRADS